MEFQPKLALLTAHRRNFNVSKALDEAAVWAVNMSGFFVSNPKNRIDENGVVRDFWRNKQGKAKSGPPSLRYHLGVPIGEKGR